MASMVSVASVHIAMANGAGAKARPLSMEGSARRA